MTREITFTVAGTPRPMLASPTKEQEAQRLQWRALVVDAALRHHITWIRQSPLHVRMIFQFERPKSATTDIAPTGPPLPKLQAEVLDALVAGRILIDASQVHHIDARKRYGEPGCVIRVTDAQTNTTERAA